MTYSDLVREFSLCPRDVHTVPLTEKEPVWFYTYAEHDTVYVESGRVYKPQSHIRGRRALDENEFSAMLELYFRRKQGIPVSREAIAITENQVYWYGIFSEMHL